LFAGGLTICDGPVARCEQLLFDGGEILSADQIVRSLEVGMAHRKADDVRTATRSVLW
jgi:hypothetical protein